MTLTMNPDVKQLWLDALESGEFRQGRNRLGYVDATGVRRFCCLGVLCELAVRAGVIERAQTVVLATTQFSYGGFSKFLPPAVQRWAGLESASGNPVVGDNALAFCNDALCWSFTAIAAAIREHL